MHEVFQDYANRQARLRREQSTRWKFDSAARRFSAWCDETGVDPLHAQVWQIEEYFAGTELAPTTKAVELT